MLYYLASLDWSLVFQSRRGNNSLTKCRSRFDGDPGKAARLRLDPEAYRRLCREVLERDGWRCQSCGCIEGLQVHHISPRSRLGDDTAENLIALCAKCHQNLHRRYPA